MTKQEKSKLNDFFDDHICILSVEFDPSKNVWDMKPMKGAKEEFIKHFTDVEKNQSGGNLQP